MNENMNIEKFGLTQDCIMTLSLSWSEMHCGGSQMVESECKGQIHGIVTDILSVNIKA